MRDLRRLKNCFQVRLQATLEGQGKKVADLEDYIDSLLIRIMETAPVLLEKTLLTSKMRK